MIVSNDLLVFGSTSETLQVDQSCFGYHYRTINVKRVHIKALDQKSMRCEMFKTADDINLSACIANYIGMLTHGRISHGWLNLSFIYRQPCACRDTDWLQPKSHRESGASFTPLHYQDAVAGSEEYHPGTLSGRWKWDLREDRHDIASVSLPSDTMCETRVKWLMN